MVKCIGVEKGSPAYKAGVRPGDALISVNGHEINDVLDYDFYTMEETLAITVETAGGERQLNIKKEEYQPLGLEFESYLIDKQHHCKNKCIFCFVDQLPHGMRESLYFKDDDERLSFLFGNYVTLTNLQKRDIERLIEMHISPVNVSVHTTNPELRVMMMKNPHAADSLEYLRMMADAGLKMNTQLVLCPGINDGEELRRSITDLAKLYPAVESIACVPVGLTKHREGLYPLESYSQKTAQNVIDIVQELSDNFIKEFGTRLVYPSDEFFLKAGQPIPDADYYEEFPQLANGVGMIALTKQEFSQELSRAAESGDTLEKPRKVTLATGVAAAPLMKELAAMAMKQYEGLTVEVVPIVNDFFGHTVTVAGLVTGGDLIAQLRGRDIGDELLIPSVMLRHEQDVFLDDVSREEVCEQLGTTLRTVENDGAELLDAFLGIVW
ncbi:MAG: DUF512 domain-containing protein [Oscillospiraceae bacterium]|nr:DUF512 domain-containing protein [Oscillospiraceae bacterium]